MKRPIPNQIVHYCRGQPFLTITSLSAHQIDAVIGGLHEGNSWGRSRFADGSYLKQRIQVENKMRTQFIEKGGEPKLLNPIYFFLGRNRRLEEHPQNIGYCIELSKLDKKQISFSYGDSMFSFNEENRKLLGEKYNSPMCDQLYMLDELESLLNSKLFPSENPLAIEAHLWIQPPSGMASWLNSDEQLER